MTDFPRIQRLPPYVFNIVNDLKAQARRRGEERGVRVATGVFQAMMQVESVNDGPVTLLLDSRKAF